VICRGTFNFNISNSTNVHEGTQENPTCLILSFSQVKSSGLRLPHLILILDLFSSDWSWNVKALWCFFTVDSRLRVLPLSLSPSCVTRKKTARKKWPSEIHHFFLAVFFCVTHDGLSERGTTRSLSRFFWDEQFPLFSCVTTEFYENFSSNHQNIWVIDQACSFMMAWIYQLSFDIITARHKEHRFSWGSATGNPDWSKRLGRGWELE